MSRSHIWSEAECSRLIELYSTGMTYRAIGKVLGVSEDAVSEKVCRLRTAGRIAGNRRKPAAPRTRKHRKAPIPAAKPTHDPRTDTPPTHWGWFLSWPGVSGPKPAKLRAPTKTTEGG